jgi:universal stress protein A
MYDKVIVALDLSDSSQLVIDKAIELVGGDISRLSLAHTVEPIPTVWGMESYAMDPIELQGKIVDSARQLLAELASKSNIDTAHQHTVLGDPAHEIRKLAEDQNADAIVMGSHGHSGWKVMLGSTANKLLHGARCDVLTVHVSDE